MRYLIVIVFIPTLLFSQNTLKDDSLKMAGQKGIAFSIDGYHLGKFEGGIGGRYWLSDKNVIFISAAISYFTDLDGNRRDHYGGGFSVGFERHFLSSKTISPYYGASCSYSGRKYKYNTGDSDSKNEITLRPLFGIEIFIIKEISLSANYEFNIKYNIDKLQRQNYQDAITENLSFYFDVSPIIITVYF